MMLYLKFNDKEDFENAARGFIGKPDTLTIKNAQGRPVRDANDTMMKKQSQCRIWQAGNERRILKRSYLCEHV